MPEVRIGPQPKAPKSRIRDFLQYYSGGEAPERYRTTVPSIAPETVVEPPKVPTSRPLPDNLDELLGPAKPKATQRIVTPSLDEAASFMRAEEGAGSRRIARTEAQRLKLEELFNSGSDGIRSKGVPSEGTTPAGKLRSAVTAGRGAMGKLGDAYNAAAASRAGQVVSRVATSPAGKLAGKTTKGLLRGIAVAGPGLVFAEKLASDFTPSESDLRGAREGTPFLPKAEDLNPLRMVGLEEPTTNPTSILGATAEGGINYALLGPYGAALASTPKIYEAGVQGLRAREASKEAKVNEKFQQEKYGTIEAATKTRKGKQKEQIKSELMGLLQELGI